MAENEHEMFSRPRAALESSGKLLPASLEAYQAWLDINAEKYEDALVKAVKEIREICVSKMSRSSSATSDEIFDKLKEKIFDYSTHRICSKIVDDPMKMGARHMQSNSRIALYDAVTALLPLGTDDEKADIANQIILDSNKAIDDVCRGCDIARSVGKA